MNSQTDTRRTRSIKMALAQRFNLIADKAPDDVIEKRIREAVELHGATPWILMFAILIASIGLNVNSTAVIIGAMLISPLMGPIMGIGHGVAIHDFAFARKSFISLIISSLIGLLVSALYFTLSPLSEAQSELLARTSPTLWDVLIAFFGGMAGIIGLTREEKSAVIPGVAIATALMPPLCTAGYGLANGNWHYFFGAFYLFLINSVFIAVASFIGIRLLRFPFHTFVDAKTEKKVSYAMWGIALIMALPSVYFATNLVKDEVYRSRATQFVRDEFVFRDAYVIDTKIDPGTKTIDVSLIGTPIGKTTLERIQRKLTVAGIEDTTIKLHQSGESKPVDMSALKTSLMSDLFKDNQLALEAKEKELESLRSELATSQRFATQGGDMLKELQAQQPAVSDITISTGYRVNETGDNKPVTQLLVHSSRALNTQERERTTNWFKLRSKSDDAIVIFDR